MPAHKPGHIKPNDRFKLILIVIMENLVYIEEYRLLELTPFILIEYLGIFQRLHIGSEYEGAASDLQIAKKCRASPG